MRYENWEITGFDKNTAETLCRDSVNPINPLIAVLMTSRGLSGSDDLKTFLDSEKTEFFNPFLMTDMDKAVSRINKAVENDEFVAIYGDYDVDGMTSAALLAHWLDLKGVRNEIYIPGRFEEGYGLHSDALDILKNRGAQLVITVDCGITATAEAHYAQSIGIDLIITDHHECKEDIPDAIAVVNPKRADCRYPFNSLAGVGVVFKLVCALEDGRSTAPELFDRFGQFVALGTVADVMPVIGENRMMILRGLKLINSSPIPGIKQLIKGSNINETEISATTVSYALAPRLNAAGRMGDPMLSVKLLLSQDSAEADKYVELLCRLNDKRRELESEILDASLSIIGDDVPTEPIVLSGDNWHQGVTGIIAAKLADRFGLPSIVISIDDAGLGHGSCRSSGTYSIYNALCACEDILVNFGGHNMAAGITVNADKIDELRKRIAGHYNENKALMPHSTLSIDFEVEKPKLLSAENVEELSKLEPFGRGNPPACLCIKNALLTDIIPIGAGKHTKLKIKKSAPAQNGAAHIFECVFFSVTPESLSVSVGDAVDIAFEPQINVFRDRRSVQLQLLDIRKTGGKNEG